MFQWTAAQRKVAQKKGLYFFLKKFLKKFPPLPLAVVYCATEEGRMNVWYGFVCRFLFASARKCGCLAAPILAVVCNVPAHAGGPVEKSDEFPGGALPPGWTVVDNGYLSPTYPGPIIGIDLSYSVPGRGRQGEAQIFAIGSESQGETQVATLGAATAGAALRFPEDADYRAFRIGLNGLALNAFRATWFDRRLDAPSNVVATALGADSMEVSWAPVDGATSYRVCVWTNNIIGASAGTEAWVDDFSSAAAGAASAAAIGSDKFNDSYADTQHWECNRYIYPYTSEGAIRIGGADKLKGGALLSPVLPAGDWHLRIRAWRYKGEDGTDMPIMRVSGGVTSLVSVAAVSTEPGVPEEIVVKLPVLDDGDRLLLCSFTNKLPRVILDRVALVSGYSEGTLSPEVICETTVDGGVSCVIGGLPQSMLVNVGITATGAYGSSSEQTDGIPVDLSNPPPHAILNAVPISSLPSLRYRQDFESINGIKSGTNWYNGVTLPYWQAFADGVCVDRIYVSNGASTRGSMYVLSSEANPSDCAFGALVPSGASYVWGVAFSNDTANVIDLTDISFAAEQWGFKNTVTQSVNFAYLVTNELVDVVCESGRWISDESWRFETPHADGVNRDPPQIGDRAMPIVVDCHGVAIRPGEVLILRWDFSRPKNQTGSSAILGIDDIDVGFSRHKANFVISIVKSMR